MNFGFAFFGAILLFIVFWRLLVLWSNWYRIRRLREMARVMRIDRRCERPGSQDEFHRSMRNWK